MNSLKRLPAVAILLTFMLVFCAFTAPPAYACEGTCECCGCSGDCDNATSANPCDTPCTRKEPCESTAICITKHPYDEPNVPNGTPTSFVVIATGYDWISWEFMTSQGDILTTEDVTSNFGYTILGWDSTKLVIRDMPWGLNGWKVRAVFHDSNGCEKRTNWACIGVVQNCAPCYEPDPPCHEPTPPCGNVNPGCGGTIIVGGVGVGGFVPTGPTYVHTETPGIYVTDGFIWSTCG